MARRLGTEEKLKILKLLKEGFTSEQCAQKMKVSAPTINNLRAHFKMQGEVFPNNRGRKKRFEKDITQAGIKVFELKTNSSNFEEFDYQVNGIQIKFFHKPKTIRIGKNRFFVEFD